MKVLKISALSLCSLILFGCATSQTGDVYSRDQTRREMRVRTGVVESIREVILEGPQTGAGTFAGAAIGGVAGSTVGSGNGQIVGAIIGAVLGGLAGSAIENDVSKKKALEISVQLDSGTLIAIVQEAGEVFYPGDRVRILSDNKTTRVTR